MVIVYIYSPGREDMLVLITISQRPIFNILHGGQYTPIALIQTVFLQYDSHFTRY